MTTLAEVIVNDVSELLQDINKERWSDAVLLRWMSESQQLIATHKPESVATRASVALAAGVDQSIPTDGLMLLRARRNTASGAIVQLVDEDSQNRIAPTWPGAAQTLDANTYIYDPEIDPLTFMVSPPNNGSGSLEVVYAKIPTPVAATTSAISVNDSFVPLIKDYVMYRALQMETEGQNLSRAAQHLSTFLQGLGLNSQTYQKSNPNQEVVENG
jgi:hypothetical protein